MDYFRRKFQTEEVEAFATWLGADEFLAKGAFQVWTKRKVKRIIRNMSNKILITTASRGNNG